MVTKVCTICGFEFESKSGRRKYCDLCMPVAHAITSDSRYTSLPKEAREEYISKETLRRRGMAGVETPVPCRYCGTLTVHESGFCETCRENGFDDLCRETGKTNGWDAKPEESRKAPPCRESRFVNHEGDLVTTRR